MQWVGRNSVRRLVDDGSLRARRPIPHERADADHFSQVVEHGPTTHAGEHPESNLELSRSGFVARPDAIDDAVIQQNVLQEGIPLREREADGQDSLSDLDEAAVSDAQRSHLGPLSQLEHDQI